MALSPLVYGEVRGGKLKADDPALLVAAFRCHEGKRVSLEVKRFQKRRTDPQNDYYWGVIVLLAGQAMGYEPKISQDKDAVHEILKWNCNFEMRIVGRGADRKEMQAPRSTADLSTAEFEAYCERCRNWASVELNLYIPLPNEVAYSRYTNGKEVESDHKEKDPSEAQEGRQEDRKECSALTGGPSAEEGERRAGVGVVLPRAT